MNPNDKKMHPDDKRNMIVFMLAAFALFAAYDIFIKAPYERKVAAYEAARAEYVTQNPQAEDAFFLLERDKALTTTPRVKIETPHLSGSLNLYGSRFDDLSLKDYFETIDNENNVILLDPANTEFTHYAEFGWVDGKANEKSQTPGSKALWRAKGNETLSADNPVTLTWRKNASSPLTFERKIEIDENYMFAITDSVRNTGADTQTLYPYSLVTRHGQPREQQKAYILHEGPIAYVGEELHEHDFDDLEEATKAKEYKSDKGWIGMTQKYWLAALVPDQETGKSMNFRFVSTKPGERFHYQTDITGAPVRLEAGESTEHVQRFFAGPKKVRLLDAYERDLKIPHFDLAVDFGMFFFLTKPFFYALTSIGHYIGSFAIALLIFTVCLRLLVFPLANKSYRSFAGMRKVGPQMNALKEKYGSDRQKLQAAIFELYKKENVNPMAGCLPILVQIPIFFALYKVLFITIEMRHTPFFGWIQDMSAPDPTAFLNLFGLLPYDVPGFLAIGAWPVIMCCTMMLQMRLSPAPQDPVQKQVQMFMPILFMFFLARFPAGLVIYWSWSNTLALLQQYTIMRMMGVKVNIFTRTRTEKEGDEASTKAEDIINELEGEAEAEDENTPPEPPKPITPPKRKRK